MNRWIRIFLGVVSLSAVAASALAQGASFAGTWTVDVQGSNRQRTAVVSQSGEKPRIAYGWKEPSAKIGPVESGIDPSGALTWTTSPVAAGTILGDISTLPRSDITTLPLHLYFANFEWKGLPRTELARSSDRQ